MKNRNENTTFIQLTYRNYTFFETFFMVFRKKIGALKNPS